MKEKTSNNSNAVISPVAKVQLGDYEAELREDDLKAIIEAADALNGEYIDMFVKMVLRLCTDFTDDLGDYSNVVLSNITLMISMKDTMERLADIRINKREG